jgi:hypothetical protein
LIAQASRLALTQLAQSVADKFCVEGFLTNAVEFPRMIVFLAETQTLFGFEHPFGLIVSFLGVFLLGIGWVGKKRLETWDEALGKIVERAR